MAISLEDPLVQTFIFYSSLLVLKVIAMSIGTGMMRVSKKIVANPEDLRPGAQVKHDDPDIERWRRAHLNDLENIPAFWIIGALYLTTNPFAGWASMLFRVFTLARIFHTISYAVIPMPGRGIGFGIGFLINAYMAVQVLLYYISAM